MCDISKDAVAQTITTDMFADTTVNLIFKTNHDTDRIIV